MKIEDISIYTRHTVSLRVISDERLNPDYSKGEFRVQQVNLGWLFENGSWSLADCRVAGPMVKKDGSDGERVGKADFAAWRKREKPAWLVELIERYEATRPEMIA
jgi:hypothetical protein